METIMENKANLHKKSVILGKSVLMVLVYFKMPNSEILREWFPFYTNMWEVQQKLAANINTVPGNILLTYNGEKLHPWIPLAGLDFENTFLFLFNVEILQEPREDASELPPCVYNRVMTILSKEDRWLELTVQIEVERHKKEWLGGLRNKVTGVEYHNATTQAGRLTARRYIVGSLPRLRVDNFSQTPNFDQVAESTQTRHDHGTQMYRAGLYFPTFGDRVVEPGKFKEFVEPVAPGPPVCGINRFKRKCLEVIGKAKEEKILQKKREILQEKMEILKQHTEAADWNFTLSTVFPTDRYGFENLYFMVNSWYEKERKKLIDAFVFTSDPGFKAFLINVFKKKLSYFRQIDVLRNKQREESVQKQRLKLFDGEAKPKITYFERGHITVTETSDSQKYKLLKEMYSCYVRQDYTPEERVEMLLQMNSFLENNIDIDLTLPVIELIDREIDMITMGVKQLKGLRLRISEYLFYIFTMKDFKEADADKPEEIKLRTVQCLSCGELKLRKAFPKRSREHRRYCNSCQWLRKRNVGQPPLEPCKLMLQQMRRKYADSFILDIIELHEIFTLVYKIWHGSSAISGCRDARKLWLAAWDPKDEWLPWNCVLLTKDEAEVHEQSKVEPEFYAENFVSEVRRKNVEAKMVFEKLHQCYLQLPDEERRTHMLEAKKRIKDFEKEKDPFFNPAVFQVRRRTKKPHVTSDTEKSNIKIA